MLCWASSSSDLYMSDSFSLRYCIWIHYRPAIHLNPVIWYQTLIFLTKNATPSSFRYSMDQNNSNRQNNLAFQIFTWKMYHTRLCIHKREHVSLIADQGCWLMSSPDSFLPFCRFESRVCSTVIGPSQIGFFQGFGRFLVAAVHRPRALHCKLA